MDGVPNDDDDDDDEGLDGVMEVIVNGWRSVDLFNNSHLTFMTRFILISNYI